MLKILKKIKTDQITVIFVINKATFYVPLKKAKDSKICSKKWLSLTWSKSFWIFLQLQQRATLKQFSQDSALQSAHAAANCHVIQS